MRSAAAGLAFTALLLAPIWAPAPLLPVAAAVEREQLSIASKSGPHVFRVERADDDRERARGLMFRREMAAEDGMLFDFGAEQPVGFWMENTYLPLDMLFIKADGTVESIARRTTPFSRKTVPSRGPVRYVLEINGGVSDELGISAGDKVSGPALASPN